MAHSSRRRRGFYAITGVLTLATCCLVVELGVRLLVPSTLFALTSNIYRNVEHDHPQVGYTLRPNLHTTAFGTTLITNDHGFRGPQWRAVRQPGRLRVAVFGDSHAFGFGVSWDDTLGEQMRRRLARERALQVELLNFAVNGYNAEQSNALIQHYLPRIVSDVVVLVISSNDHAAAPTVDEHGMMFASAGAGPFAVRDQSVQTIRELLAQGSKRSRALQLALLLRARRQLVERAAELAPTTSSSNPQWLPEISTSAQFSPSPRLQETVARPIDEALRAIIDHGAKPVLACFCAPSDYRTLVQHLAAQYDAPLVELLAVLPVGSWEETVARYGLGWDPHLGPQAHRIWGRELARAVDLALAGSRAGQQK